MSVTQLRLIEEVQEEQEFTFDDFWALYPRRVAKKAARTAWDRISSKQHQIILESLFEWARIWNGRDLDYIPHPASWLNGERWEDDFPPGHKPYAAARQQEEKNVEMGERKAMPKHVLDAIKRMRQ